MRPSWNLTVCMEISHVFLVLWKFTVCTEVFLKIVVKLPQILWSGIAISLKNFRMYGSFHKIVVKLTQKLWSGIAISLKIFRMYGSFAHILGGEFGKHQFLALDSDCFHQFWWVLNYGGQKHPLFSGLSAF